MSTEIYDQVQIRRKQPLPPPLHIADAAIKQQPTLEGPGSNSQGTPSTRKLHYRRSLQSI